MYKQRLDPQPGYPGIAKFVRILDPWHPAAFEGTPAERESSVPRAEIWAAEDYCGNIVHTLRDDGPAPGCRIEHDQVLDWCWVWDMMPKEMLEVWVLGMEDLSKNAWMKSKSRLLREAQTLNCTATFSDYFGRKLCKLRSPLGVQAGHDRATQRSALISAIRSTLRNARKLVNP